MTVDRNDVLMCDTRKSIIYDFKMVYVIESLIFLLKEIIIKKNTIVDRIDRNDILMPSTRMGRRGRNFKKNSTL